MSTKYFYIIFILIISSEILSAQINFQEEFKSEFFLAGEDTLWYRILSPTNIEEGKKYPLVLFLHGAGQRGNDNLQQLKHGIWNFARPEIRKEYPAYIIAPQTPSDQKWSVINWWGSVEQTFQDSISPVLAKTTDLLKLSLDNLPIDKDRVYVTGLSMGGFGTWEFIQRNPSIIAAAVPVCGGGDLTKAKDIANIPIWTFHGALDRVVKPEFSRMMVDSLRKYGGNPGFTEYPDINHDSWVRAYSDSSMINWLFRQKRD